MQPQLIEKSQTTDRITLVIKTDGKKPHNRLHALLCMLEHTKNRIQIIPTNR